MFLKMEYQHNVNVVKVMRVSILLRGEGARGGLQVAGGSSCVGTICAFDARFVFMLY